MSDSSSPFDLLSSSQANKEATANALFNECAPALLWGRRALTTAGLTWGYYGGRYKSASIANGSVSLTNNATNYIVAARSNGAVSVSTATTNWNDSANYIRLYLVVTLSGAVTSYEDHRDPYGLAVASATVAREIQLACSDLSTAIVAANGVAYVRAPRAGTITGVRASLKDAQTSGSIFTVDINVNGSSILSTKLTIDNNEKTSVTAATAAVLSSTALADDNEITVDVDQAGTGPKGLVVTLLYNG